MACPLTLTGKPHAWQVQPGVQIPAGRTPAVFGDLTHSAGRTPALLKPGYLSSKGYPPPVSLAAPWASRPQPPDEIPAGRKPAVFGEYNTWLLPWTAFVFPAWPARLRSLVSLTPGKCSQAYKSQPEEHRLSLVISHTAPENHRRCQNQVTSTRKVILPRKPRRPLGVSASVTRRMPPGKLPGVPGDLTHSAGRTPALQNQATSARKVILPRKLRRPLGVSASATRRMPPGKSPGVFGDLTHSAGRTPALSKPGCLSSIKESCPASCAAQGRRNLNRPANPARKNTGRPW